MAPAHPIALLLVSARLVARAAGAAGVVASFGAFVDRYRRAYSEGSAEYGERKALYGRRVAGALAHNSDPGRRWDQGTNDHWDRTDQELQVLLGRRGAAGPLQHGGHSGGLRSSFLSLRQGGPARVLPMEVSWANLTAARTVANQGACGSCWAITAAKVLEAHSEIHSPGPKHRTFSAQQLLDCVPNPRECGGQGGCSGATIELAFDFVMKNGLADEGEMPYAAEARACAAQAAGSDPLGPRSFLQQFRDLGRGRGAMEFQMASWHRLPENRLQPLMRALAEKGPVGVSVAADSWFTYEAGVFDACPRDAVVNHAVVLLGYGGDGAGNKYWLIQNSWGSDWGEGGRIRILRHDDEEERCGTDSEPSAGSACKGGPAQVTVCGSCGILYDTAVPLFIQRRSDPVTVGLAL